MIAVDTWLGAVEFWTRFINTPERDLQFVNGYPSVYYTFLSNVLRHEVQDFVVPLPSPSTMAAQILTTKGIRADIIHVDGYMSTPTSSRIYTPGGSSSRTMACCLGTTTPGIGPVCGGQLTSSRTRRVPGCTHVAGSGSSPSVAPSRRESDACAPCVCDRY